MQLLGNFKGDTEGALRDRTPNSNTCDKYFSVVINSGLKATAPQKAIARLDCVSAWWVDIYNNTAVACSGAK
jgi:hypothetical protein